MCAKNIYNYSWGNILLYWLKDGICVITLPTLYPQISNCRSIIHAILSVKFQNMPINNTFLSKLIHCAKYLMYWLKKGICIITFPTPYPKILLFSQYVAYDFTHDIANIWDIPVIFVFCTVFGVVNNMQTSFYGNTVLSYLPMDQPLKICVKQFCQKTRQSCLYW